MMFSGPDLGAPTWLPYAVWLVTAAVMGMVAWKASGRYSAVSVMVSLATLATWALWGYPVLWLTGVIASGAWVVSIVLWQRENRPE